MAGNNSPHSKKLIFAIVIAVIGFITMFFPFFSLGEAAVSVIGFAEETDSSAVPFFIPFIVGLLLAGIQLFVRLIKPINLLSAALYLYFIIFLLMMLGAGAALGEMSGVAYKPTIGWVLSFIVSIIGIISSLKLVRAKNKKEEVLNEKQ